MGYAPHARFQEDAQAAQIAAKATSAPTTTAQPAQQATARAAQNAALATTAARTNSAHPTLNFKFYSNTASNVLH
jgi:hypothetical protein